MSATCSLTWACAASTACTIVGVSACNNLTYLVASFFRYAVGFNLCAVCFFSANLYYLVFCLSNNLFADNLLSFLFTVYIFNFICYVGSTLFTFFNYGFNTFVNIVVFFFNGFIFDFFFFGNLLICYTVYRYLGFFGNLLVLSRSGVVVASQIYVCCVKKVWYRSAYNRHLVCFAVNLKCGCLRWNILDYHTACNCIAKLAVKSNIVCVKADFVERLFNCVAIYVISVDSSIEFYINIIKSVNFDYSALTCVKRADIEFVCIVQCNVCLRQDFDRFRFVCRNWICVIINVNLNIIVRSHLSKCCWCKNYDCQHEYNYCRYDFAT